CCAASFELAVWRAASKPAKRKGFDATAISANPLRTTRRMGALRLAVDERVVDFVYPTDPCNHHRSCELFADTVVHAFDAERAAERQAVQYRPAEGDGIGTKSERLEDIGAAADAAIHDDGYAPVDGGDDIRQ